MNEVVDIMNRHTIVDIDVSTSYTTSTTGTVSAGDEIAVPIVEEQLRVGKRQEETGGVRVNTRMGEVPVEEQVTLRDETVTCTVCLKVIGGERFLSSKG